MNAMTPRERLAIMVRTDRGSMTVWSPGEVRDAIDAFRAEVLREAAEVAVRAARACGDTEAGQYAASVAASIGNELRRMADAAGKDTPAGGESTRDAGDFFQPGRTYTRNLPYRAPEDRPNFRCVAVGQHPTKDAVRAFGFEQPGDGAPWGSAAMRDVEWQDGWVDVTEGGAVDA
ncbi:hypothetical protein ACH4LK_22485 [Streptomyces lydicus]|uniref:hypothetical protein n=1 Tax=Streptomyces lydicus TaxID=47763 RepID=UPI0037A2F544